MTEENTGDNAPADTVPAGNNTVAGGDTNDTVPAGNSEPPVFDWRKELSGGDADLLKKLERFSSPADYTKSYLEAEKRIREGFKQPTLPENATPEQVAEYRKQIGVPDAPDGYKLNLPDGIVVGEADKPLWDLFLTNANKMNLTQSELDKVAPAYYAMEASLREQQDKDVKEAFRKNEQALKAEWGSDYQPNLNINENFLVKEGGDALKDALMNSVAPDGSPLANHPVVAKFLNNMARMQGFADNMVYDSEAGLNSTQSEIDAIMSKRTGANRDAYYKDSRQVAKDEARLNELFAIRERFRNRA